MIHVEATCWCFSVRFNANSAAREANLGLLLTTKRWYHMVYSLYHLAFHSESAVILSFHF